MRVSSQLRIDGSTLICVCVFVCCDRWPWQWGAVREDGSNSAPARARPTCGCTRRVSAPWPAFIFRAQSYIGMIANVRLISLSSAAGPIWISVRDRTQGTWRHTHTHTHTSHRHQTKILCVMTCKLHMQQTVAVALLWHSVMKKKQPFTNHTHARFFYKFNSRLHHLPRATPGCLYSCLTSLNGGSVFRCRIGTENVVTNYTVTYIQS